MAKQTYRLYSNGRWQAMSGNAVFAVTNQPGSAKKITIEAVEINPTSFNLTSGAIASTQIPTLLDIGLGTVDAEGLAGVVPTSIDSASTAWPSSITIRTGSAVSSVTPIRRVALSKRLLGTAASDLSSFRVTDGAGRASCNLMSNERGYAATPLTIRPGESLVVAVSTATPFNSTIPIRTNLTLALDYATESVYVAELFTPCIDPGQAVLTIRNDAASGRVLRILGMGFQELGTFDSPYFRLVPIGALDATAALESSRNLLNSEARKLDSSQPDLNSSQCRVWQDVPILPYGVPQSYLAEASAGLPKGYNYLHTKDFDGPQYSTLFPEFVAACAVNVDGAPMALPQAGLRWKCDAYSKIVLREGEGIALVSSAETATAGTTVGASGWIPFDIGITFSVEAAFVPSLTVSGVVAGSDVVILAAGTTTVLADGQEIAGTTFAFTSDDPVYIDVCVFKAGYIPLYVRNYYLSAPNVTLPVAQVVDRAYIE